MNHWRIFCIFRKRYATVEWSIYHRPMHLLSRFAASLFLIPLLLPTLPAHAAPERSLIKRADQSAVYYVAGGKRYAFPNDKVFFSWYADFANVITVTAAELAAYPLGGNVTYRPGVRLIKVQTDPKVYAVSRYGTLRWMTSESIASSIYGSSWNTHVHDVPDAFFVNYVMGSPVNSVGGV
jgi:hypothetical protein